MRERIFANFVYVLGILVMLGSGLCTAFVGLSTIGSRDPISGAIGLFSLVLGGVPFLIGLGIFFLGRRLLRDADRNATKAEPPSAS